MAVRTLSSMEKHCRGCDKTLPRDAFYGHRNTKDGLQYRCIECQKTVAKGVEPVGIDVSKVRSSVAPSASVTVDGRQSAIVELGRMLSDEKARMAVVIKENADKDDRIQALQARVKELTLNINEQIKILTQSETTIKSQAETIESQNLYIDDYLAKIRELEAKVGEYEDRSVTEEEQRMLSSHGISLLR
jgi:hypothetical protein